MTQEEMVEEWLAGLRAIMLTAKEDGLRLLIEREPVRVEPDPGDYMVQFVPGPKTVVTLTVEHL